MNTLSLLTISFLASLVVAGMEYTRQRPGRMGLAALVWLLLGFAGIYAGCKVLIQTLDQVPIFLWLTYWIIPLYFLGVTGYWLRSLYATWQKWAMLCVTVRIWRSAGYPREEALKHILGALSSQGHTVPSWMATCLFWVAACRNQQAKER